MIDNPSRLELLHFARRVVEQQAAAALAQLDGWIAAEEARGVARQREAGRRPPPDTDWFVELGPDRRPRLVHRGDCWNLGQDLQPAERDQARDALLHQVAACDICRPDTALGVLE